MLACVLWLQLYVRAFGDEVFGTALQKLRRECQHSKNLITLAGRVVVGFSLTQQKHEKENKQIFTVLNLLLYWNSLPHMNPHTVMNIWNMASAWLRALFPLSEKLKSWNIALKKSLTKPPFVFLFLLIHINLQRAASGYFANRKDDTRTFCNYVQRYRFSPVFTCKTWAISFGI